VYGDQPKKVRFVEPESNSKHMPYMTLANKNKNEEQEFLSPSSHQSSRKYSGIDLNDISYAESQSTNNNNNHQNNGNTIEEPTIDDEREEQST